MISLTKSKTWGFLWTGTSAVILFIEVFSDDPHMRRRIIGCKEFNADTKQGLEYLFENKVVERTPEAVARFFIEEKDRLSKFAVGTFLGEV
ncbi:Cytohesin-3 [Fasciolopsis buskii]|uniref:Cytohesin-3 n=1 Tax=Fasciolopsis buskii TaxID=27845 RepID=A0A8E0VK11_9TREM|nr:Cytohesin-3 [Fasciolopsis buski]